MSPSSALTGWPARLKWAAVIPSPKCFRQIQPDAGNDGSPMYHPPTEVASVASPAIAVSAQSRNEDRNSGVAHKRTHTTGRLGSQSKIPDA